MLSATGLAAILLLAAHPMLMFDAGFQLSFTAVAGIGCAQLVQTETAKTKKEEKEGVKKEVKREGRLLHQSPQQRYSPCHIDGDGTGEPHGRVLPP